MGSDCVGVVALDFMNKYLHPYLAHVPSSHQYDSGPSGNATLNQIIENGVDNWYETITATMNPTIVDHPNYHRINIYKEREERRESETHTYTHTHRKETYTRTHVDTHMHTCPLTRFHVGTA